MPNSRRTGSSQGSPQGIRRPRVAGLRNRPSQDTPAESSSTAEASAVEEQEAPVDTGGTSVDAASQQTTAEPDTAEPEASEAEETAPAPEPETAEPEPEPAVAAEQDVAEAEAPESGSDQAVDTVSQPVSEASGEQPASEESSGNRQTVLVAGLLALAVLCTALTVWFLSQVLALSGDSPAANEALVDSGVTSEVNGQITDAVEKVFSYDFADTGKTERAAADLLVGGAVDEYNRLFTTVKQQAPLQKLVVTTTVKSSGVTRLQGDRAEVLVFVDQNAVRTDSGQSNIGPAQISVSAEKQGDQWKISNITQR